MIFFLPTNCLVKTKKKGGEKVIKSDDGDIEIRGTFADILPEFSYLVSHLTNEIPHELLTHAFAYGVAKADIVKDRGIKIDVDELMKQLKDKGKEDTNEWDQREKATRLYR